MIADDTPHVVLSTSCVASVVMHADALGCDVDCWPATCDLDLAWRLPAAARSGRLAVDGVASWERIEIWIRCSIEAPASVRVHRAADIDGDGYVDAADLSVLLGDWGGPESRSDLNIDGDIDAVDQAVLLGAWGQMPTSGPLASGSPRLSAGAEVVNAVGRAKGFASAVGGDL